MTFHSISLSRPISGLGRRVIAIYALLAVLNLGAWGWAFIAFHGQPLLLGTSLLAWGFGLRHAVDADHIAAIDNITRKMMQEGKRPVSVGLFFALGHSTIVLIVAALVASTAIALQREEFANWRAIGGTVSTLVSALFLFVIAAMNISILRVTWRAFSRVRRGVPYVAQELEVGLGDHGFLARIFRPAFKMVSNPLWMFPLGFLFGLGFDTATEVSLLGISAHQASSGISIGAVLVFPALFAAGMALVDTTDGIMMLGVYDWAFVKPVRKLYYNLCITLVAVIVAVLIGGIEALGLLSDKLGLAGAPWTLIGGLNANFNDLGFVIIAVFVLAWALSFAIYRLKGYDRLEPVRAVK